MPVIHMTDYEYRKMRNNLAKLEDIKIEIDRESIEETNRVLNSPEEWDTYKLCYVDTREVDGDREVNVVYFSQENPVDVWGDDWDDAPYEHNAGTPYSDSIFFVVIGVYSPSYGYNNSPYTVQGINQRAVPWLRDDEESETGLYAGATVNEFIEYIERSPEGIYF